MTIGTPVTTSSASAPALDRPVPEAATERWYSAPNLVSLSRIPLALVPWFVGDDKLILCIVVALAALSDGLDGFLARLQKRNLLGEPDRGMGAWLDPLCDKIFVVSTVLAAWYTVAFPLWMIALVLTREILLVLSAALRRVIPAWRRTRRVKMRAVRIGKATTAAQFLTLLALVGEHSSAFPLAVASGVLGALAAIHYLRLAFRMPGLDPNSSGS